MGRAYENHGGSGELLYSVWAVMRQRCCNRNNPEYHNYGGRGIHISFDWSKSYTAFRNWALANGYKEGLEIDRKNNNGHYTPENCRWITPQYNSINKRKQKNTSSVFRGVSLDCRRNGWASGIKIKGIKTFLGYFDSELQAALAYDAAAYSSHGQFAKLNFPERYFNRAAYSIR